MEYVYAALLLHSAGKDVTEEGIKKIVEASGAKVDDVRAKALVAAPDAGTWIGRRDRTLLALALQTGLRNSEIRALRHHDVGLAGGAHVR